MVLDHGLQIGTVLHSNAIVLRCNFFIQKELGEEHGVLDLIVLHLLSDLLVLLNLLIQQNCNVGQLVLELVVLVRQTFDLFLDLLELFLLFDSAFLGRLPVLKQPFAYMLRIATMILRHFVWRQNQVTVLFIFVKRVNLLLTMLI